MMTSIAQRHENTMPPDRLESRPEITTRLTPYTTVPRMASWFAVTRSRQRLGNFLIFCAVPSTLFWIWYVFGGSDRIPANYELLRVAAPLSGLFIVIGPLAFQQGEFVYERLLRSISEDGSDEGWDLASIQRKINKLDRIYYRVTAPLTIVVAVSVGYVFYQIRDIAPVTSVFAKTGALVILLFNGFVTATGVWGAIKVTIVVHTITSTANPTWSPFRTEPQGIHEIFRFAWTEGLIFSLGNITAPALLVVMPRLPPAAKVIAWGFIALTFVGGLLFFILTSRWLLAMANRQHADALDRLAPTLEDLAGQVPEVPRMSVSEVQKLQHGLDAALRLHQHIQNSTPSPVSHRTVLAATTTVVIPVLLTLLQVVVLK